MFHTIGRRCWAREDLRETVNRTTFGHDGDIDRVGRVWGRISLLK